MTANNITVVSSDRVFSGDVAVYNNNHIQLNDLDGSSVGYVNSETTGLLGDVIQYYWPTDQIVYPVYPYRPQDYGYDYQWHFKTNWCNLYVDCWRADTSKNDRIVLSLDVPGVALDDIDVSIDTYVIQVTGKRHDTGASVSHSYTLPQCYDTKSVAAKLDCGVLTLTVKKLSKMKARKITVKAV